VLLEERRHCTHAQRCKGAAYLGDTAVVWSQFTGELSLIEDTVVSIQPTVRNCFGELKLPLPIFCTPFLLRKFHFEQVLRQYRVYFARLYVHPIMSVFAAASTVVNPMRLVRVAALPVAVHWASAWHRSRWFSMLSLIGAIIITMWVGILWLGVFLD
jgi:hypothetical protein